jgi:hypothetical protein
VVRNQMYIFFVQFQQVVMQGKSHFLVTGDSEIYQCLLCSHPLSSHIFFNRGGRKMQGIRACFVHDIILGREEQPAASDCRVRFT